MLSVPVLAFSVFLFCFLFSFIRVFLSSFNAFLHRCVVVALCIEYDFTSDYSFGLVSSFFERKEMGFHVLHYVR